MEIERKDKDSTEDKDSSSGMTSPDIVLGETQPGTEVEQIAWNSEKLRSKSNREHWTTKRGEDRNIYYLGDSLMRCMLRQNWNQRDRHGEGFPGAKLAHLCPHPRFNNQSDYFQLDGPADYKIIIIQVGGNDVHNKRFHQVSDNTKKEDEAREKGIQIKKQSIDDFELETVSALIIKMRRATDKLRRRFPNSHLIQLSIQPRQEINGMTTIRALKCITKEVKKEIKLQGSTFNMGDTKIHYLEISGVWDQGGELRSELYNDYKGELVHLSTEGNNTLDALYSQIEDFLTDHNLNKTDTPSRRLTGKCNNGEIKLHH
jgi:hypothetical protein